MPKTLRTARLLLAAIPVAFAANAAAAAASSGGAAAPAPPALHRAHGARHAALATWFGPGFYGHETACGQILTPTVIGVANRTLPCGTLVRITYAGRSVTVPVIDRGPYGGIGASWDLTAGAAQALGALDTIHVTAAVVGRVPVTPTLGKPAESAETGAPSGAAATLAGGASAG
jgi:rare lipoprotein A (peptidoglycan hydrolase)